jgi:nucleotide-binding universal stress UspA family protein
MYRSIVVPLDGSSAAEHALPWALSIAERHAGAVVHLVRAHIPPAPVMVGSELAADIALDAAIRGIETKYLEEVAQRVQKKTSVTVQYALLDDAIVDAVLDYAKSANAGLVVLTTHGRGAFARFWLGSVADGLMRHATVPTLMLRPRDDEQPADFASRPTVQRLVLPLDGSELAERIIEPAIELGKTFDAEYALVLVLEAVENIEALAAKKLTIPGGWFPEATAAKADAYLEHVVHRLRGRQLTAHRKVIPHGAAAGAVLEYAHTHGHSAIALATHGRSGLKRLLLGSVADKIIRGATMPVLIYHPAQDKG